MRILIAGSGGVGGLLAGALARVHEDTFLYARGESFEAISKKGITIHSSSLGNFTSHPHVSDDPSALGTADVIFLAVKGNTLAACVKEISPACGKHTIIVPLLNGIDVAKQVKRILPAVSVAEGLIYVFSHRTAPGCIEQTAGSLRILFGMDGETNPPVLQEAAALLCKAGFDAAVSDDMRKEIWKKFGVMGGNSAALFALGGPAGRVRSMPGYSDILRAIADEVVEAAKTEGVVLDSDFPANYAAGFATLPDDDMTSLYRDIASGKDPKNTELETVLGAMVRISEKENLPLKWFYQAYQNALKGRV